MTQSNFISAVFIFLITFTSSAVLLEILIGILARIYGGPECHAAYQDFFVKDIREKNFWSRVKTQLFSLSGFRTAWNDLKPSLRKNPKEKAGVWFFILWIVVLYLLVPAILVFTFVSLW